MHSLHSLNPRGGDRPATEMGSDPGGILLGTDPLTHETLLDYKQQPGESGVSLNKGDL